MIEPLLLRVARLCVGVTEAPGPASNPVIMQWAKDIGAPMPVFTSDSVAWCVVAANRWLMACGYPLSGTGYDLLRARSFAAWGVPLTTPALGAVLVFHRPAGAHVGLYIGEREDAYYVLGANQGDAVSYMWIAKDRLVAVRWPAGVPLPELRAISLASAGGPVSLNEA